MKTKTKPHKPDRDIEDERDRRLLLAEEILSDLATGYWCCILDKYDSCQATSRMGQRIQSYWKECDTAQKDIPHENT